MNNQTMGANENPGFEKPGHRRLLETNMITPDQFELWDADHDPFATEKDNT